MKLSIFSVCSVLLIWSEYTVAMMNDNNVNKKNFVQRSPDHNLSLNCSSSDSSTQATPVLQNTSFKHRIMPINFLINKYNYQFNQGQVHSYGLYPYNVDRYVDLMIYKSPLYATICSGHFQKLRELVFENPNYVHTVFTDKHTPLTLATVVGDLSIVKFLLDHKADLDYKSVNISLCIANQSYRFDIVKLLIQYGANINFLNSKVRMWIKQHNEYDKKKHKYTQAELLRSINYHKTRYLQKMIEYHMADINLYMYRDCSLLAKAVKARYYPTIDCLIRHGADVNFVRQTDGFTLLHLSASNKGISTTKLLLSYGLNVNKASKNGLTPLHIATIGNSLQLIKLFLCNGAYINAANNRGQTALLFAVQNGSINIITYLLNNGADIQARTTTGKSILDYAKQYKNTKVINILDIYLKTHQYNMSQII